MLPRERTTITLWNKKARSNQQNESFRRNYQSHYESTYWENYNKSVHGRYQDQQDFQSNHSYGKHQKQYDKQYQAYQRAREEAYNKSYYWNSTQQNSSQNNKNRSTNFYDSNHNKFWSSGNAREKGTTHERHEEYKAWNATVNEGSIAIYFFGLGLAVVISFAFLNKLLQPLSPEFRNMQCVESAIIGMNAPAENKEVAVPFWLLNRQTGRMMLVEKVTVGLQSNDANETNRISNDRPSKKKRREQKFQPNPLKPDIFDINERDSIFGPRLPQHQLLGSKFENRGLNIH